MKYNEIEKEKAVELYEVYCSAVGGVNYAGQPLPSGADFFADEGKKKQAEAWYAVARAALAQEGIWVRVDAQEGAKKAAAAAKVATGWRKWLLWAVAVVLGAASFLLTGCGRVTAEQVAGAHALYHVVTGTDCVLVPAQVEESEK